MDREMVLSELEEKITHELQQLTKKENITPSELEAMTKATCLLEKIVELRDHDMGSSEGYSERSYGHPRMTYPSYRSMYDGSYERGRSPVTGRYMSRDESYDHGYSGHSIQDRMIDRLERMMDEAESSYEKQIVEKWIKRLSEDK